MKAPDEYSLQVIPAETQTCAVSKCTMLTFIDQRTGKQIVLVSQLGSFDKIGVTGINNYL